MSHLHAIMEMAEGVIAPSAVADACVEEPTCLRIVVPSRDATTPSDTGSCDCAVSATSDAASMERPQGVSVRSRSATPKLTLLDGASSTINCGEHTGQSPTPFAWPLAASRERMLTVSARCIWIGRNGWDRSEKRSKKAACDIRSLQCAPSKNAALLALLLTGVRTTIRPTTGMATHWSSSGRSFAKARSARSRVVIGNLRRMASAPGMPMLLTGSPIRNGTSGTKPSDVLASSCSPMISPQLSGRGSWMSAAIGALGLVHVLVAAKDVSIARCRSSISSRSAEGSSTGLVALPQRTVSLRASHATARSMTARRLSGQHAAVICCATRRRSCSAQREAVA